MKLFESAFNTKEGYFERVYNTETQKSEYNKIENYFEYYLDSINGPYSYLLDTNRKLKKVLTKNPKEAMDQIGTTNPIYRFIRDNVKQYNPEPRVFYLDIETRALGGFPDPKLAEQEITLIQILDSKTKNIFILGLRDWKEEEDYKTDFKVNYVKFNSEIDLLNGFVKLFQKLNPLIVYAWNGEGFDFPYIYNRMKNLGLDPNGLSVFNNVKLDTITNDKGQVQFKLRSSGHYFMDYMEVYKRFESAPRSSYSLDNISEVELNEHKISHTEYGDFDSFYTGENYNIQKEPFTDRIREKIRQLQIQRKEHCTNEIMEEIVKNVNFQFVWYGIHDVILLYKIDLRKKLTSVMISLSQITESLISDQMGTCQKWAVYTSNLLYRRNIVPPKKQEFDGKTNIVGGFVRDPVKGLQKWVMNFDINSMYPLLSISAFNISPDTFVPLHKVPNDLKEIILRYYNNQDEGEKLHLDPRIKEATTKLLQKYNYSLGLNGAVYDRSYVGIVPEVIMDIYNNRKKAKKTMLQYESRHVDIQEALRKSNGTGTTLKDSLEYSKEELLTLSKETLEKVLKQNDDKADEYHLRQLSLKILMNSLYGALGNKHFMLFNEKMAQSITMNGRFFIQKSAKYIDEKLKTLDTNLKNKLQTYIVYGDTDSVYYTIRPFVEDYEEKNGIHDVDLLTDYCLKFEEENIQPVIAKCIDDFAYDLNAKNKGVMGAKLEVVADRGFYVAKKKYVLRVRDCEGTRFPKDNPKIKVMGLELVKSTTPEFSKKYLKESINIILDKTENDVREWYRNIRNSFKDVNPLDFAITAKTSSLNYDLDSKETKAVPLQARAAIRYNMFIKKVGLDKKFKPIQVDEKFKRLFLIEPNIFNTNVIGFNDDEFLKIIQEQDCIDYDTSFEKGFENPLKIMTDSLGYDIIKTTVNLDEW